jgi:hypothetical protein
LVAEVVAVAVTPVNSSGTSSVGEGSGSVAGVVELASEVAAAVLDDRSNPAEDVVSSSAGEVVVEDAPTEGSTSSAEVDTAVGADVSEIAELSGVDAIGVDGSGRSDSAVVLVDPVDECGRHFGTPATRVAWRRSKPRPLSAIVRQQAGDDENDAS